VPAEQPSLVVIRIAGIEGRTASTLGHTAILQRNFRPIEGDIPFVARNPIEYLSAIARSALWRTSVDTPKDLPISRQRVLDEIRETMACIGLDPADVNPAAHLVDDLDLDSLDWVDLAMRLEETFPIPLQESRFASLRTVQDLVDRIHTSLLEAQGDPA
jgi:acyl carrier protein